jgi:predicted ATPase
MSFALSGASGTGKTTLAKAISEIMGIPYHDASVTRIMNDMGIDPVSQFESIEARIDAQERLLAHYIVELSQVPRPFITDRTPLDMAAYAMGEVTMLNTTQAQGARIAAYVQICKEKTKDLFDAVAILRPLPFYESKSTRPPPNAAYQQQTQTLIEGFISQTAEKNPLAYAVVYATDLERRTQVTVEFLTERIAFWQEFKSQVTVN